MALQSSNNFYNAIKGYQSLFSPLNKAKRGLDEDDTETVAIPEFKSTMKDEDIMRLTTLWEQEYESYLTGKDIKQQQKDNLNYWIGKQFNEFQTAGMKRPLVDNLLFEAVETFLPIATRGDPEANVVAIGDFSKDPAMQDMADKLAKDVQGALMDEADRQRLRMILKGTTRNWMLYLIGVIKITWDSREGEISTKNILPSRLIFDINAEIAVGGQYRGEFIGEKRRNSASRLIEMFPEKKSLISQKCDGNLGTKLTFIEWTTKKDVFFTLDHEVLGKFKNPHWNYDGETEVTDPVTGEVTVEEVVGRNHFKQMEIPYLCLSIFSLGRRPHDETSLIYQNIPLQDLINRRYQQIDKNVDAQNNGIVLSGKYFTKEQAAEAATQLARGNPLWVPEGDIQQSYKRDQAPALASDVFDHLNDARGELRNIFGTSGSTAEGVNKQDSVRGKILVNQLDSSRIGGGVTEYIEQLAATWFNWQIQMMYVYFIDEHHYSQKDAKKGAVAIALTNTRFMVPLKATVKDGSLIPKDPLTQRNEAIDLWSAEAIDPITLYEKLDYPNPYESAKELLTWKLIQTGQLPPQAMFPDFQSQAPVQAPNTTPGISNTEEQGSNVQAAPTPVSPQNQGQQLLNSVPLQ